MNIKIYSPSVAISWDMNPEQYDRFISHVFMLMTEEQKKMQDAATQKELERVFATELEKA